MKKTYCYKCGRRINDPDNNAYVIDGQTYCRSCKEKVKRENKQGKGNGTTTVFKPVYSNYFF